MIFCLFVSRHVGYNFELVRNFPSFIYVLLGIVPLSGINIILSSYPLYYVMLPTHTANKKHVDVRSSAISLEKAGKRACSVVRLKTPQWNVIRQDKAVSGMFQSLN